jgi:hypothetical protein
VPNRKRNFSTTQLDAKIAAFGPKPTLVQRAAKVGYEPKLPIFCAAAKVGFRKTGRIAPETTALSGPCPLHQHASGYILVRGSGPVAMKEGCECLICLSIIRDSLNKRSNQLTLQN